MRHLAAAEPDGGFHFVTFLQPLACVLHPVIVIVVVGPGTKLNFLDYNRHLLLLRFVCLLLGFVLKLSEVNDPANRRVGSRGDLDQIQPFSLAARMASRTSITPSCSPSSPITRTCGTRILSLIRADRYATIVRSLTTTSKACSYYFTSSLRSFEFNVPSSKLSIANSKLETRTRN